MLICCVGDAEVTNVIFFVLYFAESFFFSLYLLQSDYPFFKLFPSKAKALDYIGEVFAYVSLIYKKEVGLALPWRCIPTLQKNCQRFG